MSKEIIVNRVKGAGLCTVPTLENTFDLSTRCIKENIPGDFVECGVFAGVQPAIMAYVYYTNRPNSLTRRIHLFDSFEGIPQAGPKDDASITALIGEGDGSLTTTGISACSVEAVQSHMKQWGIGPDALVYHKGWFQDTVPSCDIDKIAVLRLDGDLYESTKVCMENLYPKLSSGGFLIIDDYRLTGCQRAITEYFDSLGESPTFIDIEGGLGPVWMQKK